MQTSSKSSCSEPKIRNVINSFSGKSNFKRILIGIILRCRKLIDWTGIMIHYQAVKCKLCGNPNISSFHSGIGPNKMFCSFRCNAKNFSLIYLSLGVISSCIGIMVIIVGTRFILLALLMLIPASFLFFSGIYGAKVTIKEWQPPPSKPSQQSKLNKNIAENILKAFYSEHEKYSIHGAIYGLAIQEFLKSTPLSEIP